MAECEAVLRSSHGGDVPQVFIEYQMVQELGIQPSELDSMDEWRFHLWHQFMLMEVRTAKIRSMRDQQHAELAQFLKQ